MHIIPKKANILRADAMKGIMLLTTCGKLYHIVLLLPWTTATKLSAQIGGFGGRRTSFATHLLRIYCSLAKRQGQSFGFFFFDVKAAFHSMIREHTFVRCS